MSKISVGSRVMVAPDLSLKKLPGIVLDARELSGGMFVCAGMFEYLVDIDDVFGPTWYDWYQVESVDVNSSEPKELEVKTQQICTVGELKKLLDKMDDSIKFTFSDLKIHFG